MRGEATDAEYNETRFPEGDGGERGKHRVGGYYFVRDICGRGENNVKSLFSREISPESLVRIYEAMGRELTGKVAVKISTGESAKSNHLRPELIGELVQKKEQ